MPRTTPFIDRDCESWTNDAAVPGPAEVLVENSRIECAGEQATVVAERLRGQDENVGKVCRLDAHKEMLS